jgi:basement membrane-specific heparan sulfate proteoglycan core protein
MCEATGEQPITLSWERVREQMPRTVQTYQGRLQFYGISVSDAGRYVCRATNRDGSAEAVAEVIVEGKRQFYFHLIDDDFLMSTPYIT